MLKFFIATISIGVASCAIYNYCDTELCKGTGFDHITCGSTGGPGPKCSDDVQAPMELNDEVKQKYVDLHNKYRNKIANGEEPGFKSAAKMATMEWSDELADYAALNVLRCEFKHDCHATPQMKYDGQNIYAVFAYVDDMSEVADKAISSWYSEVANATQSNLEKCCTKGIGHFTQMVADRANRFGCAVGQFNNKSKMTYVACNYSFGNLRGSYTYKTGAPASDCKTGNNPNYPALCSSAEEIDPNNTK